MAAADKLQVHGERHNDAGPLFLVGMPRSGTKLLREMLNEHPRIRFSDIETDFLPYWVEKWPLLMPTCDVSQFEKFYGKCHALPFFIQNAERGHYIKRDEWFTACRDLTAAGVFEGLMRCCLRISHTDRELIWADKSPSYVRHVPLLLEQFPTARVIHIIRDVRDYGLSIHKAWRKSILRAAQRWQDDVSKARNDGRQMPGRYCEVRYEDLLTDPRSTLAALCAFLAVSLDQRMLTPQRIVENIGAARNTSSILQTNTEKYRMQMLPSMVTRIEQIAGETLRDLGYPCEYGGTPVRVPGWRMQLLQLRDGWNVIRSGLNRHGVVRTMRHNLRYFSVSGNRR